MKIKSKKNQYLNITNLLNYLDRLKNLQNCMAIISVKDTAGFWLDEKVQTKLAELRLKNNLIKKLMVGYIAIIKNGNVIFEVLGQENESVYYNGVIEEYKLEVTSRPFHSGNMASIKINGIEHAVNGRGLNIVVFDTMSKEVIDSVAFDTHVPQFTCIRQDQDEESNQKVHGSHIKLMKKHYDIALNGLWWAVNYGSQLNGYAVYKVLKQLGLSVLMIMKPNASSDDWELRDGQNVHFIKQFYSTEEICPPQPLDNLVELNDYCDIFLTGSDQLWNYYINKGFGLSYFLGFVKDEKKKISFATSFGYDHDITPKEILPKSKKLLERFNAISVREPSGVEICSEVYGVKAQAVLEPVFCLEKDSYNEIIEKSQIDIKEPYILTYILDPTEEKKKAIEYYSNASGMKAINVLDADPRFRKKNEEILNLPNTMGMIGAEDLLKLYTKCSFVITDSFHGTAFSIIFNKPFLAIANAKRGAIRFLDLLNKFGLEDRLVLNSNKIPYNLKYLDNIDYSEINEKLKSERKKTIDWLHKMITTPINDLPNIKIPDKAVTSLLNKKECVGCSACINACPKHALILKPDDLGYYRSYIDYDKCINCGICSKVCPALSLPHNKNFKKPNCFEFVAANDDVLYKSTSGGVFPLLADKAFEKNGYVAGAAWKKDFSVEHILISDKSELYKLQKSKYLQSYMGNVFEQIKEKLISGKFVLFSGCPCQVAGLKKYLGQEYDNLLLIDLLCGNSPSTMFFKKYLQDSFGNNIKSYEFRFKSEKANWHWGYAKITTKDDKEIVKFEGAEDNYQRVYHSHTMCAPHCEKCKYQTVPRFGDLTIGDFWGISGKDKELDTKKGVSVILCNNQKGRNYLNNISDHKIKVLKEVPLDWLGGNGYAINNSHNYCSAKRDIFYQAIKVMPFGEAVDYALKPNHGIYDKIYEKTNSPLQFSSNHNFFKFDSKIWEEHYINNYITLMVKDNNAGIGKYATIPLYKELDSTKRYILSIRFRIKTSSKIFNLHIKDSGSNYYQIIHTFKIPENYVNKNWIELHIPFVPKSNIFDEFMIGASQISGQDNYVVFDYINITEE